MAQDVPNKFPEGFSMADVPEGFDKSQMDEVLKCKAQANDKFKEGDYFSAKCLYSGALEMLERCCLHLPKADSTWESIKNNMALCDLKRKEWTRVIDTTTEILTRNPSSTKALYRRGVAHAGQGKCQDAIRDLKMAIQIEPDNVDARNKLTEIVKQTKEKRNSDKDQAEKLRGFLRGERLEDSVAITEDGGIRKIHGNENAPLLSPWIKRAWLSSGSGLTAAVTAHVVIKTADGKELFSTRKAISADNQPNLGPGLAPQAKNPDRPPAPARWVLDDRWGCVFKAWNAAVKCVEINEVGRFEVAKFTLGPSVESTVERCMAKWLQDNPARKEMFKDTPPQVQLAAKRKQALQILALPEQFCMEPTADPNTMLKMEMELLTVNEYTDIDGDGCRLLNIIREGKKRSGHAPVVTDLCTVSAHYRISKLLMNYSLVDTRLGLAEGSDGLTMKEDPTKEPIEFIVGEEETAPIGDFVPPCIGRCLLSLPDQVVEGMHFELILRDGLPVSEMDKHIHDAYAKGMFDAMPDCTGPVLIKIEVEKVIPPTMGPSTPGWNGVESIQQERTRALTLEEGDEGKHKKKAGKRWNRIISWLEQILEGRRWKVQSGSAAREKSMYDLDWDEGQATGESCENAVKEQETETENKGVSGEPRLFDVEEDLLKQLDPEELGEWARAHAAISKLLASDGATELSKKHALCAVQACKIGDFPKELEIGARSTLASQMMQAGQYSEALEVLKQAQALDPVSSLIKDQAALATQKYNDEKAVDMKGALKLMKQDITDALEASDTATVLRTLNEIDNLPLTWEAVSETAIGKEVGKCAKYADSQIAERANGIIAKLHVLAKKQRPMWVR